MLLYFKRRYKGEEITSKLFWPRSSMVLHFIPPNPARKLYWKVSCPWYRQLKNDKSTSYGVIPPTRGIGIDRVFFSFEKETLLKYSVMSLHSFRRNCRLEFFKTGIPRSTFVVLPISWGRVPQSESPCTFSYLRFNLQFLNLSIIW